MRGNTLTRLVSSCILLLFTLMILCILGSVQAATAPVIQSISPEIADIGYFVDLTGSGFGSAQGTSFVAFGSFPSSVYTNWTDTLIECQIPALPGVTLPVTGPVTVVTPDGTSNALSITIRKTPTVTAISPPMGFAGTTVDAVITGTYFQQGAKVEMFAGWPMGWGSVGISNVTVVSDSTITCRLSLPNRDSNIFIPNYFGISFNVYVVNPDGATSTGNVTFGVSINPCGAGAGASIGVVGLFAGMLSLAGTLGIRRRLRWRKST